jgi:hypothetical protein
MLPNCAILENADTAKELGIEPSGEHVIRIGAGVDSACIPLRYSRSR